MSKIIVGDRLIKTYPNPRYGGMTPLDGNKYLVNIWAKIQSKFSREKLHPFGLRISEPHHDGTPHWHLSLFAHPDHLDSIENIFKRWCLADSPDEKGAKKNRVKIIRIKNGIDPTTGKKFSAVGYMLKYLFKNITGSGLDNSKKCHTDWSGQNPLDSSQSITTWVRDNRIRQFQFFGGPSVTVWRELRRLEEQSNYLEKIRLAAASADWSTFIELMGGMNTAREDRPVKPAYGLKKKLNPITGEILEVFKTRYGDESSMQILGIVFHGTTIISRTEIWSIETNPKTLLARQKAMDCVVDTLEELHDQDCKNIAVNSNLLRSLAAA
jgi:hypothetical protein